MKCPHCKIENPERAKFCIECGHPMAEPAPKPPTPPSPEPASFAGGRYQVKKFLGEGGKKKVYLAHDDEWYDRTVVEVKGGDAYADVKKRPDKPWHV